MGTESGGVISVSGLNKLFGETLAGYLTPLGIATIVAGVASVAAAIAAT